MRSQHKRTDLGNILERDWVTTNGLNVLRFGSGRNIYYNSGNFVFTTSKIPNYNKKHRLSTETKEWKWGDCENADDTVNTVAPSFNTTDLRDYAYYGSCVELVRATIEEIISEFPGRIIRSNDRLISNGDYVGTNIYVMNNSFQIDLHHKITTVDKYDNEMRYMAKSWSKYCVVDSNGNTEDITSYVINTEKPSSCISDDEGKVKVLVTINNKYIIKGYYIEGNIIYTYDGDVISIQPQQEYIDEYFNGLSGFKKQLLRQDTKPLYMNKLITPTEVDFVWYYPIKAYVWPSDGYCIDIDSIAFSTFVSDLYDIAQNFDELWSDNIYRSMTHESIKNFDWSYRRQYTEGDEQDNVEGGERMQKLLRIMGRVFDDTKVYMDALKQITNVTYDQYKNGPEALLSDMSSISGFDVKSTISKDYDIDTNITNSFLNSKYIVDEIVGKTDYWVSCKDEDTKIESTLPKWYPIRKSEDVYPDVCDNEFMRRILLSSKRIMQTKGTQEAIEMVFGMFGFGKDVDYAIEEEAYYTENIIRSDECIDGTIDGEKIGEDTVGEDWSKTEGVTWTEIESSKKGDLAVEINGNKESELLYDSDQLSGVPLREVCLGRKNNTYLVPYYDSTQLYDGDLVFQCNGGWGKMIKDNDDDPLDDRFDYQETLSYLHVVSNINALLSLNVNTLEPNDIYYVVNLDDYTTYDSNPPISTEDEITMSHYFCLIDRDNSERFSSWKNIVVKNELDSDGNLQMASEEGFKSIFGEGETRDWKYKPDDGDEETETEKLGTYYYAFKKMQYLDNIVSLNTGNNPHVGYGQYDDGSTYLEYMKLPFKYSIDNSQFDNFSLYQLAKKFEFDLNNTVNDKIQIVNSRGGDKTDYDKTDYVKYEYDNNGGLNENNSTVYDNVEEIWYINTKVLTITNKVTDNYGLYKNYFKTIIMPYIMQVIPSTTILKLKGFS